MESEAGQAQDEPKQPARDDGAALPGRGAAGTASDTASQPAPAAAPQDGERDEVLRLQPRLVPRTDGLYYVNEILGYHDEAFVEAAYAAVLLRRPEEEEFRNTLADLRGGAREKIEILRELARTAEGKSKLAFERVAGLRQSRLAEFVRGLPLVGHLWRVIAAVARLPKALRHQRQFEAYALAQQQLIADFLNAHRPGDLADAQRPAEFDASQLEASIADASAAVSMLSDAMAEMGARHADQLSQVVRRLEEAERRLAGNDARLEDHAGWFGEYGRGLEDHGRQLTQLGQRLDEYSRRLDAQQEFLTREQHSIVEAQKAAIADAKEDLSAAVSAERRELAALAARVKELRAAIEAAHESAGGKL